MRPRPSALGSIRSAMSSSGSPKNAPPPCCSSCDQLPQQHADRRLRDAAVVRAARRRPRRSGAASTARRSLKSSSGSRRSSQYLNTSDSTLAWVSLRPSTLPSSSGPNDDTVARSWAPQLAAEAEQLDREAGRAPGVAGLRARARSTRGLRLARRGQPGDVALDVGHEHRHARRRQLLGHQLERLGLAGAGGAGDRGRAGSSSPAGCRSAAPGGTARRGPARRAEPPPRARPGMPPGRPRARRRRRPCPNASDGGRSAAASSVAPDVLGAHNHGIA